MPGIIFLPHVYAVHDFEIAVRERGKCISKPKFGMKYGGSGYNICQTVTVFIYILEQNHPQEAGLCVQKKCIIKL